MKRAGADLSPTARPACGRRSASCGRGADEQRCTVHALRNVTAKLPERHHREVKARWWKVFDDAASPAEARRGLEAIIADYRTAYPSAMAVIERDLDALVAHLRWPSEHRKRIRTTNLLERTFVEVRRRTKVIGRFPGETSRAVADLGRARALKPRLARRHHDPEDRRRDRTHPPPAGQPRPPRRRGGGRRLASTTSGATPARFHPEDGTPPLTPRRPLPQAVSSPRVAVIGALPEASPSAG